MLWPPPRTATPGRCHARSRAPRSRRRAGAADDHGGPAAVVGAVPDAARLVVAGVARLSISPRSASRSSCTLASPRTGASVELMCLLSSSRATVLPRRSLRAFAAPLRGCAGAARRSATPCASPRATKCSRASLEQRRARPASPRSRATSPSAHRTASQRSRSVSSTTGARLLQRVLGFVEPSCARAPDPPCARACCETPAIARAAESVAGLGERLLGARVVAATVSTSPRPTSASPTPRRSPRRGAARKPARGTRAPSASVALGELEVGAPDQHVGLAALVFAAAANAPALSSSSSARVPIAADARDRGQVAAHSRPRRRTRLTNGCSVSSKTSRSPAVAGLARCGSRRC